MSLFRKLTFASVAATFLLISIGGLVRATKSGLGCGTDWPHCAGRVVPALATRAEVIEFSHRAVAGVVVILLATMAVVAWRDGRDRGLRRATAGAFALVMWQALLGAIVVKLELQAISVVLHLGTALALFAVLTFIAVRAHVLERGLPEQPDTSIARRARIAAAGVLVLLLVGSYLSGAGAERNAGFPDWPLIEGRLLPDLGVQMHALHFLHRGLAVIVAAILAWATIPVIRRRARSPVAGALALAAVAAFTAEVLVGAANVWTQSAQGLNSAFITLHLALGAAIWASVAGLVAVTTPALRAGAETSAAGHARLTLSEQHGG